MAKKTVPESAPETARKIYYRFALGTRKRSLAKEEVLESLRQKEVYSEFLKLCMEYDHSANLEQFRAGLALVVKALGPGLVAAKSGVNRVTLYRMLARGGNPGLTNLVSVLRALGTNLWITTDEYYSLRDRARRNKQNS